MVTLEAMSAEPRAVTAVSDGLTQSYLTRLTAVYVSSDVLYSVVIGCDFFYCRLLKDVRALCYCASLVRTQLIMHVRATSSTSSARIESKLNKI